MTKEEAKKYIHGRQIEIMCESELPNVKKKWRERLNKEFAFLRYVNNVLDYIDDECDDIPAPSIFEYKGYVLQQSNFNNHYMIFKDDKMIMHCQCTEKLDQKGAEEAIEFYLDMIAGKYDKESDASE